MPVGKKINSLRTMKGITLPKLAQMAGISKGHLWQIEKEEDSNPSLKILKKIADAMDVTIADLLNKERIRAAGIPDDIEDSLKEFIEERRKSGRLADENIISALCQIQLRGEKPVGKEDWSYLYESIERTIRK